jgi:hypothetical protein
MPVRKVRRLHSWDVTTTAAMRLQEKLRVLVVPREETNRMRRAAGEASLLLSDLGGHETRSG